MTRPSVPEVAACQAIYAADVKLIMPSLPGGDDMNAHELAMLRAFGAWLYGSVGGRIGLTAGGQGDIISLTVSRSGSEVWRRDGRT